ncbi:TlyA family RNA methyltransferase [Amnibacterium sp. CER49]|uniref:TlyA family RNA methyltransferase n=1 Tax=Amnibacterium sp. CER49 TaxID=3039161 RepID=UPI00244CA3DA|nr:TlyA family RNA methyltransferase [Amnibacterium sp. CER49]MDH2444946.1 TlyA family RNA methyltransferase [Amnibacterium sp. CER49]
MTSRLDVALVARGLARSRNAAARAIAEGRVTVTGTVVTRPSAPVADDDDLALDGALPVSRASGKLEAALDAFRLDVTDRLALDLGASTGGFTAVLLARGARRVVALDVGRDQLVPELRADPRVTVIEGENARDLTAERLAVLTASSEQPGVVVADLSFISLTQVLPAIRRTAPDAEVVLLVKPQFEVGRTGVQAGVVRDPAARTRAVRAVLDAAWTLGLGTAGILPSPVVGMHGNREVLVLLQPGSGRHPAEWEGPLARATGEEDGRHS